MRLLPPPLSSLSDFSPSGWVPNTSRQPFANAAIPSLPAWQTGPLLMTAMVLPSPPSTSVRPKQLHVHTFIPFDLQEHSEHQRPQHISQQPGCLMKASSLLADTPLAFGQGRNGMGQAQGKGWLLQWRGMPRIPPILPNLGCKGSAKTIENIDGVHFHPQRKEIEGTKRAPNSQRANCCIENTNDSALSESFYFCLLASVIWFQSYSLNHSEICFCMQGQLCHSCFPNFKLEDIH